MSPAMFCFANFIHWRLLLAYESISWELNLTSNLNQVTCSHPEHTHAPISTLINNAVTLAI